MSVQAIAWALSVKTKSPSAKLVLVTIANYADEKGLCWPSQALIARQSEQSIDSVQRRLQELMAAGLLIRKIRRRQSSLYQLLIPENEKPQSAVSSSENDRTGIKIPQNQVKKPQLCGTEPSLRTIKERKIEGGHSGKKGKPRHGMATKDRRRLWLDHGTIEWNEYARDYRSAHSGIDPPLQWAGSGTWFSLLGEQAH